MCVCDCVCDCCRSVTARGHACRRRAHSGWRAQLMPSGETLQVVVLSSFVQLIISLGLHMWSTGSYRLVILYGLFIGLVGAIFNSVLNAWIRGESISLRRALQVDRIDTLGGADFWDDPPDEPSEYRQVRTARGPHSPPTPPSRATSGDSLLYLRTPSLPRALSSLPLGSARPLSLPQASSHSRRPPSIVTHPARARELPGRLY